MNRRFRPATVFRLLLCAGLFACCGGALAQGEVVFAPVDRTGEVRADLYGSGARAVILAHGGRFDKESWRPQGRALAAAGFRVLALRFRGDSHNPDGTPSAEGSDEDNAADVRGAVAWLERNGATHIAAVGASLGGDAVALASHADPGHIERIVLLGSNGGGVIARVRARKLFIVARSDRNGEGPRLGRISAAYAAARPPKNLVVVEGSAHAQFLFATAQGPRVLEEITRFLSAP